MMNQSTKNLTSKEAHVLSRHKPTRKGFCSKNHSRRHTPLLQKKSCIGVFCSLIVALLAAGCGNSGSSGDASDSSTTASTAVSTSIAEIEALPQIVTTMDIWGDVASKATCGLAEVSTIIPSGSDPHRYSPSARDIIALEDAALVVENGYGLEERLLDALSSAPNKLVIADLLEEMDSEHEGDEHEDHDEDELENHDEHEDHDEDEHEDENHEHDEDEHDDHDDHGEDDHDEHDEDEHDEHDEDEHEDHEHEDENHDEHEDHDEDELEDHEHEDENHEHDEDEHEDHEHEDENHDEHENELEDRDEHDDHDHDHAGGDPHIWFDFNFARSFVNTMKTRLAPAVADAEELAACADSYIAELQETEDAVAAALASVPQDRRLLVTQHDTLQRLADIHGYEIVGNVIPSTSTLAEADLRNLLQLEDRVKATGALAIFADATGVSEDIETFADRIDLPMVVLYTESLGTPDSGADTYTGMMLTNANRIAEALASP